MQGRAKWLRRSPHLAFSLLYSSQALAAALVNLAEMSPALFIFHASFIFVPTCGHAHIFMDFCALSPVHFCDQVHYRPGMDLLYFYFVWLSYLMQV